MVIVLTALIGIVVETEIVEGLEQCDLRGTTLKRVPTAVKS